MWRCSFEDINAYRSMSLEKQRMVKTYVDMMSRYDGEI